MVAFIVAAVVLGALVAGVAVRRAKRRNGKNHPLRGGVTRRIGMFERMSNKVKNLGKNKNRPDRIVEMPLDDILFQSGNVRNIVIPTFTLFFLQFDGNSTDC